MGDSYEKVKESERVEAFRERARIIVETEKRFPQNYQICFINTNALLKYQTFDLMWLLHDFYS